VIAQPFMFFNEAHTKNRAKGARKQSAQGNIYANLAAAMRWSSRCKVRPEKNGQKIKSKCLFCGIQIRPHLLRRCCCCCGRNCSVTKPTRYLCSAFPARVCLEPVLVN
jgi:hypothetical protein